MAEGRQKASAARRRRAVQRVMAFREWMDADVEYIKQIREAADFGIPMKIKRKPLAPPAAEIPSDNDYKIAREEGAIT